MTQTALQAEGRRMHHCIGTYDERIARGDHFAYHADLGNSGCSLMLKRQGSRWRMLDLKGVANAEPSAVAKDLVNIWLAGGRLSQLEEQIEVFAKVFAGQQRKQDPVRLSRQTDDFLLLSEPLLYRLCAKRFASLGRKNAPAYSVYHSGQSQSDLSDLDDLMQLARDAAYNCLNRFVPGQGPFSHYLNRSVSQAVKSYKNHDAMGMSKEDAQLKHVVRRAVNDARAEQVILHLAGKALQSAVIARLEKDGLNPDDFELDVQHLEVLANIAVLPLVLHFDDGHEGDRSDQVSMAEFLVQEGPLLLDESETVSTPELPGDSSGFERLLLNALPRSGDARARRLMRLVFDSGDRKVSLKAIAADLGLPLASVAAILRRSLQAVAEWGQAHPDSLQRSRRAHAAAVGALNGSTSADVGDETGGLNRTIALGLLLASSRQPLTREDIVRALPFYYPFKKKAGGLAPTNAEIAEDAGVKQKIFRDLRELKELGWDIVYQDVVDEAWGAPTAGKLKKNASFGTYALENIGAVLDPAFELSDKEAQGLASALAREPERQLLNDRERLLLYRLLRLRGGLNFGSAGADLKDHPNLGLCLQALRQQFALQGQYPEHGRGPLKARTLSILGWFGYDRRILVVAQDHDGSGIKIFDPALFKTLKRAKALWREPAADFDLNSYVVGHRKWYEVQKKVKVLVKDPRKIEWARSRYPWVGREDHPQGDVFSFYLTDRLEFRHFLLKSFAHDAEVLEPLEIREWLRQSLTEAQ